MLELASRRLRFSRQLVEDSRRLARLDDDELVVSSVADLRETRLADQLGGRALPHDHAVAEYRDAIRELLRLVEVVRRQENRRAERAQRADHVPGGTARGRIEAGRRLVEEDEIGIADEGDSQVEPAFLPARERLDPRVALLAEPDELDHLVDVTWVRVVAREEPMRLGDGEQRAQLGVLEHDADPLSQCARRIAWIVTEHVRVAPVTCAIALEDLDRGGLAGSVRPEQAEDLALGHLEADTAQCFHLAVGLREPGHVDGIRHGRRRYARGGAWVGCARADPPLRRRGRLHGHRARG